MPNYGYTVNDILNMDIEDFEKIAASDIRELKRIGNVLSAAANKRYKRAVTHEEFAPAIKGLEQTGGKISFKGKSKTLDILKEVKRAYHFMEHKTSTHEGRQDVIKAFEKASGVKVTKNQYDKVWETIDKMREMYDAGQIPSFGSLGSKQVKRYVSKKIKQNKSVDDILKDANEEMTKLVEDRAVKAKNDWSELPI